MKDETPASPFDRRNISLRKSRLIPGLGVFLIVVSVVILAGLPVDPARGQELAPGGTFTDDDGHTFEGAIEAIAAEGITEGCNPPANDRFCPDGNVTRGEMAVFLVRAFGYSDNGGGDLFDDDDGLFYENAADRLKTAGVTLGCNPPTNNLYCGERPVTRAEMAAFLVRALGLVDDGGGDLYVDDDGSIFELAIDRLGTAGITQGCNPPTNDRFCPDDFVTRGQMAAFLARALNLSPITPPPRPTPTTSTSTPTTTTQPMVPTTVPTNGWDPEACTFNGIPMWGRVQVVSFFADVRIQEVDFFPDLRVQLVDLFPNSCGQWQQVDLFPDFTVEIVDFFPDLRIQYVDFFPGT